jgi:hypothetical protein
MKMSPSQPKSFRSQNLLFFKILLSSEAVGNPR